MSVMFRVHVLQIPNDVALDGPVHAVPAPALELAGGPRPTPELGGDAAAETDVHMYAGYGVWEQSLMMPHPTALHGIYIPPLQLMAAASMGGWFAAEQDMGFLPPLFPLPPVMPWWMPQ